MQSVKHPGHASTRKTNEGSCQKKMAQTAVLPSYCNAGELSQVLQVEESSRPLEGQAGQQRKVGTQELQGWSARVAGAAQRAAPLNVRDFPQGVAAELTP